MNLANVTIENASFLCPSNRFHNSWNSSNVPVQSQGIVNIGDGGLFECKDLVLTSQAATTADYQDKFRFNVTTGGVLRIAYFYNFHLNYYGKIYVDGGDIQSLTGNNKRSIYSGNTPLPAMSDIGSCWDRADGSRRGTSSWACCLKAAPATAA